jgi:multifunctional methyltransferase subunit TRM112
MRLLTHNLLQCNCKGCTGGFPLKVTATATELQESEFNADFIKAMLSKLEYSALVETAQSLDLNLLPPSYAPADLLDENFLKAVHDTISDFHIIEGSLTCPSCARAFPVNKGIPNMLLTPEEV